MRQPGINKKTPGPELTAHERELTLDEALEMRVDQARLAAHYADRVDRARAAGQYGAMRRSMQEYRRAARRCRLLGERIRSERTDREQRAPESAPLVVRLAARSSADLPSTGQAA